VRHGRFGSHTREDGNALVEFALVLPFLLLVLIGMADLCVLLGNQLQMIHLSREAANVLSRGAAVQATFAAITQADGALELDGEFGRVILTKIALDPNGRPVIVEQHAIGSLDRTSRVGTLESGQGTVPANVPNGRRVPAHLSLVVVELFCERTHLLGATRLAPGHGTIVLTSLAAF
jgi:Flp pilus assembly protein TadG